MITTYLIIAHLLSDFVLQPTSLIKWKARSYHGILFHALIFVIVALLVLFPYLVNPSVLGVVLLIGIVHFFTDRAKINIELNYDAHAFPFVADQAIHYISLLLGGALLQNVHIIFPDTWFYQNIYQNSNFILFLLGIIYFIYLVNVLFFQTRKKQANQLVTQKIVLFTIVYFVYFYTAIHLIW